MPDRPIRIVDCTLREGAQAPGVSFSLEQTEEIVELLLAGGVDMIECGHPAASELEQARTKAAVARAGAVPVLAHARACRPDVDAVMETGAEWVGLFLGFNDHSRRARVIGASMDELVERALDAVGYAVERGLHVRFTVEDASRTDRDTLAAAFDAAAAAGAERLCFADTVGALEPGDVAEAASWLRARYQCDLEFHFHDDRGLSMANALAAVDAGADWISCSVNGLGERAGITDLFVLLANLHHRSGRPIPDPQSLRRVSSLVGAFSRTPMDRMRPVVGANAFVHTARLHQRAVAIDPMSYHWTDPGALAAQAATADAVSWAFADLVLEPVVRSATELRYHRHGPGRRFVLIDDRALPGCGQYCIVREIPPGDPGPGHVDEHRHSVDSTFVFLGNGPDLTGLEVEVMVGGAETLVSSPSTVFIPAGERHSYRILGGSGLFFNFVLAGTYNDSLLD